MPIVSGQHSFSIVRMNARTSVLSIDSLDARHRGVYKCSARNKAGHSEYQSELHVNGAFSTYYILTTYFEKSQIFYHFHVQILRIFI